MAGKWLCNMLLIGLWGAGCADPLDIPENPENGTRSTVSPTQPEISGPVTPETTFKVEAPPTGECPSSPLITVEYDGVKFADGLAQRVFGPDQNRGSRLHLWSPNVATAIIDWLSAPVEGTLSLAAADVSIATETASNQRFVTTDQNYLNEYKMKFPKNADKLFAGTSLGGVVFSKVEKAEPKGTTSRLCGGIDVTLKWTQDGMEHKLRAIGQFDAVGGPGH